MAIEYDTPLEQEPDWSPWRPEGPSDVPHALTLLLRLRRWYLCQPSSKYPPRVADALILAFPGETYFRMHHLRVYFQVSAWSGTSTPPSHTIIGMISRKSQAPQFETCKPSLFRVRQGIRVGRCIGKGAHLPSNVVPRLSRSTDAPSALRCETPI
jgi:hypothetical protein